MKKSLVILLVCILSLSFMLAACGGDPEPEVYEPTDPAPAATNVAISYKAGTYYTEITFGRYPQTEVTDQAVIEALNGVGAPDATTGYYKYNDNDYAKVEVEKENKETGEKEIVNYWYIVEPIKWYVLDESNNQILAVSASNLDCMKYNETLRDIDWSKCTLRNWLSSLGEYSTNGFYTSAFNAEEQSVILTQTHTTENNPRYPQVNEKGETIVPATVKDRVSLLSIEQLEGTESWTVDSFKDTALRACPSTEYANRKGAAIMTSYALRTSSWWWLRNTGSYAQNAAYVGESGETALAGYTVSFNQIGVRPAIVLDASHVTK